ncbi:MAG: ATP-binding protein, partial [Fimbriimonadales bacterium]|nr:ATP-binding protein [Fimbriimonadales bacterium]
MDGQLRTVIQEKVVEGTTRPVPVFTLRDARVPDVPNKAFAVIGMRRAGKTTFLWQVAQQRLSRGMPREHILYFNFEDERLLDMRVQDLQLIVETYYQLYPQAREQTQTLFLLDEIQRVAGWETFARRLLDTESVALFLSGSSARMLAYELGTSMRGRALPIVIYPFSFRECLRHLGEEPDRAYARLRKAERTALQSRLMQYLREGGFPEAVGLELIDRRELLSSYVDGVILRDVVERYQVNNLNVLRRLVRQLLSNPGAPFSVNKFFNDLRSQGFSVSKDTLHAMLGYLEDAFLVQSVPYFAYSQAQQRV